jgi:hypothetical protein
MSTMNAAVVAVRLRRFWLGPAMKSPVVRASDLGEAWRDVMVVREGSTLVLHTPYDFGAGDPLGGDLGTYLAGRVRRLSGGTVREVEWRFDPQVKPPVRRARSSDLDIHAPGDPGLDEYADVLARLRKQLPADTSHAAREALGRLALAGVSRHRMWFAAVDEAEATAVRAVPGAGGALSTAVRGVQKAEPPLYRIVVDPTTTQLDRL